MYKVMLVDDEILIRERISKRIPWEELGYSLVAVCENGRDAIAFMQKEEVDLVLTDICMPYADGLEVAKYAYEKMKGTKVILISGYDEFDYAKKAVEYQVFSYVLKPLSAAELIKTLMEVKKKLDEAKAGNQAKRAYLDSLEVLKGQFLAQLVQGNVTEEVFEEKCREYKIDFKPASYCAVVTMPRVKLSDSRKAQIMKWLQEVRRDTLAFFSAEGNLVIFVKQSSNRLAAEEARTVCKALSDYGKMECQQQCSCFVGTCVSELRAIFLSYQKALEMKEFMYLEREMYIYEWDSYQKDKREMERATLDKGRQQKIVLAMKSNLKEEIRKELQEIQVECQEKWVTKNRAVIFFQSLILAVMVSFEQINIEEEVLFRKEQECISALFQCAYLSEMKEIMLDFLGTATDIMNYNRADYREQQAAMALTYIESHYADPDLSLPAICQKLAISVSYFSAAFKEYTGKTFVDALTAKRMEKAKEMLENSSLKTYEIAEKCGYRDSSYFAAIFKKAYGITPREYAKAWKKRSQ